MLSASALSRGVWVIERKALERTVSVSSPSGLPCRAALPGQSASAPRQRSIFFRPPTLPFHGVPNGTASASALNDGLSLQVSRRPVLAELIVLYKGTILAVGYDDVEAGKVLVTNLPSAVSLAFLACVAAWCSPWLYLDVGPALGILIFTYSLSFPPASFCVTRASVAASAEFLYSPTVLSCKFLSTVLSLAVAVLFLLQKELDEKVASCTFLLSIMQVSRLKAFSREVTTSIERYVSVDRAVAGDVGVLCERPN